ncbi:TPA: hypothetical protein U1C26_002059 [Streptococcus suis]|nr:hypothetical protein [Streptococcus suis]
MFLALNLKSGVEERFETRDQLLHYIDTESAKSQEEEVEVILELSHVNANGELVTKTRILLPIKESADAYLINFGIEQDKKGFVFPGRKAGSKSPGAKEKQPGKKEPAASAPASEVAELPKNDLTTEAMHSPRNKRKGPLSSLLLAGLSVALVASIAYTGFQAVQLNQLSEQVTLLQKEQEQLRLYQEDVTKVDTFSRYFLPTYFSGEKERLADFLTEELLREDFDLPGQSLQSVILEAATVKGGIYTMQYVLVVKQADDSKKMIRFTFAVVADQDSLYGYRVSQIDPEQSYPK